jgi:Ca2+-binding RTX toxin-like protein
MAIYTHNEVAGSPPISWLTALSGALSFGSISPTEVVIANSDGTFTHASLGGGVVTSMARTNALNAPFTTYETLTGLMVPALSLLNASTATLQTLFLGGNDTFTGWSGADGLLGFAGDDTFTSGGGSDTIDGGAGVSDKATIPARGSTTRFRAARPLRLRISAAARQTARTLSATSRIFSLRMARSRPRK